MSVTISYEEWMAAISDHRTPTAGAYTVVQWASKLGRDRHVVSAWIAKGLEDGWMKRGIVVVKEISGIERKVTGYSLSGEES